MNLWKSPNSWCRREPHSQFTYGLTYVKQLNRNRTKFAWMTIRNVSCYACTICIVVASYSLFRISRIVCLWHLFRFCRLTRDFPVNFPRKMCSICLLCMCVRARECEWTSGIIHSHSPFPSSLSFNKHFNAFVQFRAVILTHAISTHSHTHTRTPATTHNMCIVWMALTLIHSAE